MTTISLLKRKKPARAQLYMSCSYRSHVLVMAKNRLYIKVPRKSLQQKLFAKTVFCNNIESNWLCSWKFRWKYADYCKASSNSPSYCHFCLTHTCKFKEKCFLQPKKRKNYCLFFSQWKANLYLYTNLYSFKRESNIYR